MEIQKRIKSAIKSNKWRFYNYQNLEANLKHHLGGSKKQKRKELTFSQNTHVHVDKA